MIIQVFLLLVDQLKLFVIDNRCKVVQKIESDLDNLFKERKEKI